MTALAYFPRKRAEPTVPVVCPACGSAFPVPMDVLRNASTLGCPSCHHVRPAPAVPAGLATPLREERVSEFPTTAAQR